MKILEAIEASPRRIATRIMGGKKVYFFFLGVWEVAGKPESKRFDGLQFKEPIGSLTGFGPWEASAKGKRRSINFEPCPEFSHVPFEQAVDEHDDFEPLFDKPVKEGLGGQK